MYQHFISFIVLIYKFNSFSALVHSLMEIGMVSLIHLQPNEFVKSTPKVFFLQSFELFSLISSLQTKLIFN
jgi:hypothetical protein